MNFKTAFIMTQVAVIFMSSIVHGESDSVSSEQDESNESNERNVTCLNINDSCVGQVNGAHPPCEQCSPVKRINCNHGRRRNVYCPMKRLQQTFYDQATRKCIVNCVPTPTTATTTPEPTTTAEPVTTTEGDTTTVTTPETTASDTTEADTTTVTTPETTTSGTTEADTTTVTTPETTVPDTTTATSTDTTEPDTTPDNITDTTANTTDETTTF